MSWQFAFAAECGPEKENADYILESIVDSDWCPGPFYGHVEEDEMGNWWAQVSFFDVKEDEFGSIRDLIYSHVKALPFRFALADVEVDMFRTYAELKMDLDRMHFDHLLISHDVWQEFGIPMGFQSIGHNKMKAPAQNFL